MHKRSITKSSLNTEDCLELAAGISELKWSGVDEFKDLHSFTLHPDNANIMFSIAKQVYRGTALTAKQYELSKKLLLEYYVDQFETHQINLKEAVEKLRFPLREINRDHWVKILKPKFDSAENIAIRFPFNKKVIKHIEELKNNSDKDYHYDKHTHYFPVTENYIWKLVNIAKKFQGARFEIEPRVMELYKELQQFDNNRSSYIPGIYNFKFKNYPDNGAKICVDDLGEPNYENLFRYYDCKDYYAITHFDMHQVEESIKDQSELTKLLANRQSNLVCVNSTTWPLEKVVDSIDALQRFPLLVLLEAKESYSELSKLHNLFRNFIKTEEMSVMFRMDSKMGNDAIQFNQYVKEQRLNNIVDKSTKVVYISNNKIPKPLLQKGWKPKGIFTLGSKKTRHPIESYVQSQDLIIQYDDDVSPHFSYGTLKAEMI